MEPVDQVLKAIWDERAAPGRPRRSPWPGHAGGLPRVWNRNDLTLKVVAADPRQAHMTLITSMGLFTARHGKRRVPPAAGEVVAMDR